jgi:hypothetical protein
VCQQHVSVANGGYICGELKPVLLNIRSYDIGEARLENRDFASLERCYSAEILINTRHVVTKVSQTSS